MKPFDMISEDLSEYSDWLYRDAFTTNPSEAQRAWEKLSVDQAIEESANLPFIIHLALLQTLKERKSLSAER